MSDNKALFIEEEIIGAVKRIIIGRVNELLGDMQFPIPEIEFSNYQGGNAVVPVIALVECERNEKERIIMLDVYSLLITFTLFETQESELHCYAYADAVCKALEENPSLDGVVDRAVITGKKYVPPKKAIGGSVRELIITLRVTVEGMK